MNKADIIELVEKTLGNRDQAKVAVDSLLEGIAQSLKKGETISLRGLGTFKCVQRKARQGVTHRRENQNQSTPGGPVFARDCAEERFELNPCLERTQAA
jgi:nucleoid DNA-binding protein